VGVKSGGIVRRENTAKADKAERVATNPLHGSAIVDGSKSSVPQVETQLFSNLSDTGG